MQKHLLRTLVLSSVLCLMSFVSQAQWVSISHDFGGWLSSYGYLQCLQGNSTIGWQLDTTCSAVVNATKIDCSNHPVQDMLGIQYFRNLDTLNCRNSSLYNLSVLPDSLKYLYCEDNNLLALPDLPAGLKELDCYKNSLTVLPALPDSLTLLYCDHNSLTDLPALPSTLTSLNCKYNQLTSIPPLSTHVLTIFACDSNLLTSLPELPDSIYQFSCSSNHYLSCLPQLKKVSIFLFGDIGINCLPNYPESNIASYPLLSTVPVCDVFNTNNCGVYWNISGKVYEDLNSDCVHDSAETNLTNLKVLLYENDTLVQQVNLAGAGTYAFVTDTAEYTYTVDTSDLPFTIVCPDSAHYTSAITTINTIDGNRDFALHCKPGFDLVAQSISAIRFRPANTTTVNVSAGDATNFYNAHCAAGRSGSVQLIINGAAHYASAASGALTPTSVVNDTITWSIADFGTVNFFHDFNINVATDTTAVLGSQICFTLIVNPIAGDNNPANNILTHCFTVVGSFDPNEKEVYPAGNIDTATHWLTYTIHFQNTGTAEAQHIYVTDTLDSNVDAASFQLLAYSHQPMVQLKGNNLRFNFPNINLPDSNTNEPASHGYVQYKVKLKSNLPVGTNISNTAFIYFDFNAPVVTNTTSNTIALATGVANLGIRKADFGLNPNPASESVRLSLDESMIVSNLTMTDITGREVLHSAVQIPARTTDDVQSGGRNPQFDIRNLSPGVYFVTLENKTGRLTKKLVKQ